uniref:(California timema) hypothetical protein n=1 Tax=Timema californicum TaxID=61474 RepID=A0A7R9JI08_TIMCA|nr:unnamed protein product [Timema californicum]
MASLVLTDSSQLTSDSQHLGIYSSPMASLVLTDSSQLTSDSQHLVILDKACILILCTKYTIETMVDLLTSLARIIHKNDLLKQRPWGPIDCAPYSAEESGPSLVGYEPVSPSLPASRGSPSQRGQASTAAALLTGTSHLRSCPSHGPAIVRTRYPFLCYYPPPRFVLTQHEEPRHSLQALPDSCLLGHLHSPIPTPRHNLSRTSEPQQTLKTTPGSASACCQAAASGVDISRGLNHSGSTGERESENEVFQRERIIP